LHRTLKRQLRKLGLSTEATPSESQWTSLLNSISTSYEEADNGFHLMERSLRISSEEMADLYARQSKQLEGRLKAILGALPDLLFLLDEDGRYLEAMTGEEELLMLPVDQLRFRLVEEVMPAELAQRQLSAMREAVRTQELQVLRYEAIIQSGETRGFEARFVPTGYEVDGKATVVALVRDITLEEQSSRNSRLLETVISAAREGVVIVAEDRRVLYANPAAGAITGFDPEELVGSGEGFLRHNLDQALCDYICGEAQKNSHWQQEIEMHAKNGEPRLVWLNLDVLRNRQGQIEYYVAIMNDVTDIYRSRAELQHVATHDDLTGLPNRALFEERLEQALSRARRQEVIGALLLLDLDRFKQINDSLGHAVGDGMLVEVAERLNQACRMEDMVARLGGDEFTVVLEDLESLEQASRVAEKILDVFSRPMSVEGLELDVSTSVGIATFPAEGESIGDLLKQADAAMYEAKEAGGNQYRYHSPALSENAMSNISIQAALRSALANGELQVVYQPQFGLCDGRLRGLEALLRWPQQDGSVIEPDDFIPVAEVSGLIEPLGMWVIEEVCRQARVWRQHGVDYVRLAVNVSGRQLVNPQFADRVTTLLAEHGIAGEDLEVEITESMVIHEGDMRHRNLDKLHEAGIGLSIDDFGTGHSSLVNLKRFPLSRLKVDRSFIRDVGSDPNDEAIVGATVALAKELGLEVVAEGVETENQAAFLRGLGCDMVQGYLYAEPMAALQVSARFHQAARKAAAGEKRNKA